MYSTVYVRVHSDWCNDFRKNGCLIMNIKNSRYHRTGRSFLQRAWECISNILRFRFQWKRLRRLGESPNFLYLKDRSRSWNDAVVEHPIRRSEPQKADGHANDKVPPHPAPPRPVESPDEAGPAETARYPGNAEAPVPAVPAAPAAQADAADTAKICSIESGTAEQGLPEGRSETASPPEKAHQEPDERREQMTLPF